MSNQEVRDRIIKVCSLLSDGHTHCMAQALKADALIAKNPKTMMAKASLSRARDMMVVHRQRMEWALIEMNQLIYMEM